MRVVDPDTYVDLPERRVGEPLLRGTSVTPGYYKTLSEPVKIRTQTPSNGYAYFDLLKGSCRNAINKFNCWVGEGNTMHNFIEDDVNEIIECTVDDSLGCMMA